MEEEESGEEEIEEEKVNNDFLTAVRENITEEAKSIMTNRKFKNKLDVNYVDNEKWTPLLWASCNGNEELVNLLMEKHAHSSYTISNNNEIIEYDEKDAEEESNPFQKPKDARKVGRYTPLHWASYKGHYNLVCKFLKKDMNPLDIDMYGNTAVH